MFSEVPTFNPILPNGVSAFIEAVSKQLAKLGHEIHVFEPSQYSGQEKEVKVQDNIILHRLFSFPAGAYKDLRIALPLKTIFKKLKLKFDVVHANGPLNGIAPSMVGKRQNCVKIITYHTPGEHYRRYAPRFVPIRYKFFLDRVEKFIYNSFDLITTPANKIRKDLIARGFEERKLFVLPNCVNLQENHKRISEERMQRLRDHYALHGKKIVIYVGRMSPEKRIPDIIKIAPQVVKEDPETHFIMVGKGPYLNEYRRLAHKIAPKSVTFTGYVSDNTLSNLLHMSSLGVIFVDGAQVFDITLLNYWSNHMAVCARRAGGMGDVITHTENGMLFNKQAEAYGQILALLQDERLCKRLAEKGYKTVQDKYTVETVTNQMLGYYKLAAKKFHIKGDGIVKHILRYIGKKR